MVKWTLQKNSKKNLSENIIEKTILASALLSVFTLISVLGLLTFQSITFFQEVSFIEFFTATRWTPLFTPQNFGVLPLVSGTLLVAFIALMVSVPIGLGTAIFLSEYAPDRIRRVVKPILEILAGIPTVVYGYFAITYKTGT